MPIDIKSTVSIVAIVIVVAFILTILIIRRKNRRRASSAQGGDSNEQIYIGNLPYRVSEGDLKDSFSTYGRIVDVRVVKDRRTGRSKGYAFITYSDVREAKKSLASHGTDMDGRSMVVRIAKPR